MTDNQVTAFTYSPNARPAAIAPARMCIVPLNHLVWSRHMNGGTSDQHYLAHHNCNNTRYCYYLQVGAR